MSERYLTAAKSILLSSCRRLIMLKSWTINGIHWECKTETDAFPDSEKRGIAFFSVTVQMRPFSSFNIMIINVKILWLSLSVTFQSCLGKFSFFLKEREEKSKGHCHVRRMKLVKVVFCLSSSYASGFTFCMVLCLNS